MSDPVFIPEDERPEGWHIDSPAAAEWALSKIAEARASAERLIEAANGMIDYYERQIEKAKNDLASNEGYFLGELRLWFDEQPKRELKASWAIDLPSGKLSLAKSARIEFTQNKPKLAGWLVQSAPEYVKMQATADWEKLKKHISVANGLPVLASSGEVVEGLTVTEYEPEFKVSLR